jgi:hypothetical protein
LAAPQQNNVPSIVNSFSGAAMVLKSHTKCR